MEEPTISLLGARCKKSNKQKGARRREGFQGKRKKKKIVERDRKRSSHTFSSFFLLIYISNPFLPFLL